MAPEHAHGFFMPRDDSKRPPSMNVEGCGVCAEPCSNICGQCHSIRYCSKEHAKQDWKSHKPTCKLLAGAEWLTIPFAPNPGQWFMSNKNLFPPEGVPVDNGTMPPNTHASCPFLVKMQVDLHSRTRLMIYDSAKDFQIEIGAEEVSPELWRRILGAFAVAGGRLGAKMFMYVRRKGDWELSIAIDRLPDQNVTW